MLGRLKLGALRVIEGLGINAAVASSRWRSSRLLILAYHGISLSDEHEWDPALFMTPARLRLRLETLRRHRCAVLPLGEAIDRLQRGELPPRSVCLTFDDGGYDFYRAAHPILREFGFPATLYLSTYYSDFNRPVFDVMCTYLLWKGRGGALDWPAVLPRPAMLDEAGRRLAGRALKQHAYVARLSGLEKDALLAGLAGRLGIDYDELCRKRTLHLVTREEARELAEQGVDLQLHTHRHRTSTDREKFVREIEDNRERIARVTDRPARHFCYPGGFYLPQFPGWLAACGVVSATTCELGLASRRSRALLLPRLIDTSGLPPVVFSSWLSGTAALLPRRPHVMSEGQLLDAPPSQGPLAAL
jgi:peptidoglycan/xylan/chitin deacetylase (PgdA/CDA1 family)